jgi:hypothetical protein
MSISDKIRKYKSNEWVQLQGSIDFISGGKVKISSGEQDEDFFSIIDESAINEDFIQPVITDPCESPSPNPQFIFQVRKGTEVEVHYKNLVHKFKLNDENERSFYIDTENEKIVFIDELPRETTLTSSAEVSSGDDYEKSCYASVYKIWRVGVKSCCNTNHNPGNIYGYVRCGDEWIVKKCCLYSDNLAGVNASTLDEGDLSA